MPDDPSEIVVPHVAVIAARRIVGVHAPGYVRANPDYKHLTTYDWRAPRGSADNLSRVEASMQVLPLEEAFDRAWPTAALCATYLVYGPDGQRLARQPRVAKDGLQWLRDQGYAVRSQIQCVDIDNPKLDPARKRPWDGELLDDFTATVKSAKSMVGAGLYFTPHGSRVWRVLRLELEPEATEDATTSWMLELGADGLHPDWKTRDWTRLFFLPSVTRVDSAGRVTPPAPRRGWSAEGVWDPPPMPPPMPPETVLTVSSVPSAPAAPRPPRARTAKPLPAGSFVAALPPSWEATGEALARAVDAQPDVGSYHDLGLALAGALAHERGVPLQYVPALVVAAIGPRGASDPSHAHGAAGTVARYAQGLPVAGRGPLRARWPTVHAGMRDALARGRAAAVRSQARAVVRAQPATAEPETPPLEAAWRAQHAHIEYLPRGVGTLSSPPGLGKSFTLRAIAAARARRGMSDPADEPIDGAPTPRVRHVPDTRTGITVVSNELAEEYTDLLRTTYHVPVQRLFSPGSLRVGKVPVCRFAASARALADAGLSVQHELCDGRHAHPCPHRDGCGAYGGHDGPDDAPIVVATHPYLASVSAAIGVTGLLAVDEPPDLVATTEVAASHVLAALQFEGIGRRYADAMRPLLRALLAWLQGAPGPREATPEDEAPGVPLALAVARGAGMVPPDEFERARRAAGSVVRHEDDGGRAALAYAQGAHKEDTRYRTPPLQWKEVARARVQASYALALRDVTRAFDLAYRLACEDAEGESSFRPPRLWRESRPRPDGSATPWLIVKQLHAGMDAALGREGRCLVMDGNLEVHLPRIAARIGAKPRDLRVEAPDGAPIARTLVRVKGGRDRWVQPPAGPGRPTLPVFDGPCTRALTDLLGRLRAASATRCGLIAYLPVERALRCALESVPGGPGERPLRDAGGTDADVADVRAHWGALLATWDGRWELGHFGLVRGVNRFFEHDPDVLATLGDPWPNLGDVRRDVAFFALGEDPDARMEALCRAELEQAQERLRSCRRTRPAIALHYGCVLPGGVGWADGDVTIVDDEGGVALLVQGTTDGASSLRTIARTGGWSHRTLAEALGCSEKSIRRYLTGQRAIPEEILAAALRLPPTPPVAL